MAKVAVVGAGLLGRLLALIFNKDHHVTLFDKGSLDETDCTGVIAAAMIAPTAESVIASASIVDMGRASLQLWPELLAALNLDVPVQHKGSLILAHRQDEADLVSFKSRVKYQSNEDVQELDVEQLADLEPEIANRFSRMLYLPFEGQIENTVLYKETKKALETSTVKLKLNQSVYFDHNTLLDSDNNQLGEFDWIFDCRGLGAKKELINSDNLLRGVRGEVVRVRAPEVNLTRPVRLMHPRYPIYIVPKHNNEYVIGATEIESEDDKPASVRSALELLSAAYSVHTGFSEATIVSIQTGLRPTLSDNEPSITQHGNTFQINGLYRHGYLLTPYLLHHLVKQLSDVESLETFSDMPLLSLPNLVTNFAVQAR